MPFHCTVAAESKFDPLTVRVKTGPPAAVALGLSELIVGGGLMVKGAALCEVTPLSITVTVAEPGVAIRVPGTAAVNWVAPPKVVLSVVPFHCATAARSKPWPETVNVKPGAVAVAELGLIPLTTGYMVKGRLFEGPMSLVTLTDTVPAVTIRLESTEAVTSVLLTSVVGRVVEPHWTTSDPSKFEPVTVSVKPALPAFTEGGLSWLIVGPCPAEFVGAAKSSATTKYIAATNGLFRAPADSRRFPDGFGFSPLLLLVRLSIKGPKNEPGLSTFAGAGVSAPEWVLTRRCSRPRGQLG